MFAWALVIILAFWLISKNHKDVTQVHTDHVSVPQDEVEITDDSVYKSQIAFEEVISQTYLPDSLSGREIYIYRNLINKWYYKLSADNRYNDEMSQKLRKDILDYMDSLEQGATARYLSFELDDEESKNSYSEEAMLHSLKTYTIENAFAAAIGNDAILELEKARNFRYSSVDKDGNLVPEGHHFDISGNLKPDKIKN